MFYAVGPKNTVFLEYENISFEWKFSIFFNVQIFGLKVFISSYSGKQWENQFCGLISTLLPYDYDLPYTILKLYRWGAFSKVKFYRSRKIF
jgi:hypothetical protein